MKTGTYNKSINTATPEEIEQHLHKMGQKIKFSKELENTNNPGDVAEFIFGSLVKAKDITTTEDVIKHIKKLPNAQQIINASKKELARLKMEIPEELK